MLDVKNLKFSYHDNKILHNINFTLNKGDFSGFLGKNGAGKTTVFKCILGLINNYDGQILVDDVDKKKISIKDLSKKIAYIPQKTNIPFNYSVRDFVLMGANNKLNVFSTPDRMLLEKVDGILCRLNIENLKYSSFLKISGGEQQLVMIARAIMQDTEYIIMDEPTSALDFSNQEHIMNIISKLVKQNNIGVIISSHNPNLVVKYCDKIIAISDGTIIESGAVEKVLSEDLIKRIYGVDCKIYDTDDGKFIQGKVIVD